MRLTNSLFPVLLFLRCLIAILISSWLGVTISMPSSLIAFSTSSLKAVLVSLSPRRNLEVSVLNFAERRSGLTNFLNRYRQFLRGFLQRPVFCFSLDISFTWWVPSPTQNPNLKSRVLGGRQCTHQLTSAGRIVFNVKHGSILLENVFPFYLC